MTAKEQEARRESPPREGRTGAFPFRTVLAGAAGFLLGVLFLNLLLRDPAAEMPALAAPGPDLPAFQGLPPKRRPREIRVFVVGASLTSGYPYQPPGAASFASLLEAGWKALFPDRPVVCRPAAVPALDSPRLAELAERALNLDPTLVCVTLGTNEYANRIFFGRPLAPREPRAFLEDRISRARLLFKALWRLLPGGKVKASHAVQSRIAGKILQARPGRPGLGGLPVEEGDRRILLDRLARSMEAMSRAASARGVPLVFLAGPHDLAGSWPWADLDRPGRAAADRLIARYRRGGPKGLVREVRAARARFPRRADLSFLLGRLLLEAGRNRDAREAFEAARDDDGVPMHRTGAIVGTIRREALRLHRPFLDLNRLLIPSGNAGLPETRLFLDYGHLNLEGHLRLAAGLSSFLAERALLPRPPEGWKDVFLQAARKRIDRAVTKESRRRARPNLAWADGNFFMLFGNFRDALPLLEKAFRLGAEGSFQRDLPYTFHLLFCASALSGKEDRIVGLPEKERAALFRALYGKLLRAARKGRLHQALMEALGRPLSGSREPRPSRSGGK